jgi:hypothetical protein
VIQVGRDWGSVPRSAADLEPLRPGREEDRIEEPMTQTPGPLRRLLDGWMQIAVRFGEVQTMVLLALIYVLVIGPASLVARGFGSDFLSKRGLGESGSAWREADSRPPLLDNVKQPF